jgi:hydroxymethylpyrimidine pyrophosphatase-like HAD family hydrolase
MTDFARATAKIALVLADVDGALLTSEKVLTLQAAMAVKDLQTAGIAFAITSGRRAARNGDVDRSVGSAPPEREV